MQSLRAVTPKKGLIERVALITLVGLSALSVIGVTLVTVYVNHLNDATSTLSRTEAMPAYVGRPQSITAANGTSAMNFLVLVTSSDSLQSVVVANLSASRRNLTLITMPADLVVPASPSHTLASTFAMDPAITIRAMESLTGARMDHQLRLDLDCFAGVIDTAGGVAVAGTHLDGVQAVQQAHQATDSTASAMASGKLMRATLISANSRYSVFDPSRFNKMVDAVNPCLHVDAGLTPAVIKSTVIESSVHPEDTRLWPLATQAEPEGLIADPAGLEELRDGLTSPELVTTEQYHRAAILP
jgi:hypothetical protein